MANFTAQDVMKLREKTGVGMMDCKKALIASDGDMDKAIDILREKGMATIAKRADKIASQGIVEAYKSGDVCVLVEVNCESDFVARGDQFHAFVSAIAEYIAENKPADVAAVTAANQALLNEAVGKIGEKIDIRRFEIYTAPETNVDTYIHMGGKIGVMVESSKDVSNTLLHDIALQIAAANPIYINQSDVPQSAIDHEKEIAIAQGINEGKPQNIVEKMVPGRIQKFYKEVCLMEQIFVKAEDGKSPVKQAVGAGKILRFTRFAMGEGLEKKEENLADEVEAQIAKAKGNL